MPAGTGVWVVKTVEARLTSRAVSKSRPGPVLGGRELADPLQAEEAGVALVGVEHLGGGRAGDPGVRPQRTDAADAEQQLLAQPVLAGAAVEPVGHAAEVVGVLLDVGVEQQQRHPADVGDPDPGHQLGVVVEGDPHRRPRPVGLVEQRERELVGVEDRVGLLLPALAGERLLEVAHPVEQAHADQRDAEVGGRLEVVAGEDAEAAGVLREHGGDAELRREVRDGAGRVGAALALVPLVARQVAVEVAAGGLEPVEEAAVGGQLVEPPASTAPSSRTGSWPVDSHSSGSTAAKTSWVGGCQDHRRLPARTPSEARASGSTGRTVKRRMARTAGRYRENVNDPTRPACTTCRGPGAPRLPGLHGGSGFASVEAWSVASQSWTSCPSSTSDDSPAKATVGEPFPVTATVFREGHDKLGAEVVLIDPAGTRRAPVRMEPEGEEPDRWIAWVTPDAEGAWTFEVHAWSDPLATWQHDAGLKIPAGVDVDLMFTEGGLLLERVLAGLDAARDPGARARAGRARRRHRHHAAGRGPAGHPGGRRPERGAPPAPAARAGHGRGPVPGVRRPVAGALRQLVRVLPPLGGRDARPADRAGDQRHLRHRRQAARRRGRDGLRRDLPAADPPDRRGQPQGPQQHPHARAPRHRLAVGDRQQGRRPRRGPPRPRDDRRLRRVRRAGHRAGAGGRARPRAAGGPGPPVGHQPPGVVHHPRRRHHRLRREPAQEVPGHLPGQLRQRPRRDRRRGAAGRPALDGPRRPGLPRRQPPHQAGRVLGVAAARGPLDRPRRDLPVRGVHPAGDDARRWARSASTSPTPTSRGAPPAARSRTTSASSPARATT